MYQARTLPQLISALTLSLALALPGWAEPNESEGMSVPQLVGEAEEYALGGNYDAALPLYEQAIARLHSDLPRQHQLRYRYGIILNALGGQRPDLYPLARSQFEAVLGYIESSPGLPFEHSAARVQSALAHAYHQQSATVDSEHQRGQMLRRAYQLYSAAVNQLQMEEDWQNLAITYFNIGQVCEWQGNLEEAIEWLEQAVLLDRQHGFDDLEEDMAYLTALRELVNPTRPVGNSAI
ncbi:tetratricopeptide repeat protein [uncultured Microbulbifer sp.]|uniref:tetratricopeptide repeat protein n=1 Tax=uncultured Microbulbifer sp. TaxID=348147 RepID=UPI0025ED8084|nr:tetratricopeptide repeat protein [uncultured Microbulbifer sp.]